MLYVFLHSSHLYCKDCFFRESKNNKVTINTPLEMGLVIVIERRGGGGVCLGGVLLSVEDVKKPGFFYSSVDCLAFEKIWDWEIKKKSPRMKIRNGWQVRRARDIRWL